MIHLLIIDALNLIRRIHAVQESNCLQTCEQALTLIIKHSEPTHIVAVFDDEERKISWRHQLLPDYKANRSAMPESLQIEMPLIREMFERLGVTCWQSQGDEADDLAATLACKIAAANHKVTIVSTDKGYCQLLSPKIMLRDYFQKRWLDSPFIAKEYGVEPHQLTQFWGLSGISSSKVPGITGIGPKTATTLLAAYPTLEDIYENINEIAEKTRKKLLDGKEIAFICREIATLKTDLIIKGNLQQLRYEPNNNK